jgi:hypothetical protein
MAWIAMTRRYWFWQHKKMLADDVGYLVSGGLRPRAAKWIKGSDEPGAIIEIPIGWRPTTLRSMEEAHGFR